MAMLRFIPAAFLSAVLAMAMPPDESAALEASGTTVAVAPSAAASGQTGRRVLEIMGPVFMGDRVQTGSAGEAQIKFRDNTKLVVGRNSLLTIDAFVFDESNTARQVSLNAFRGAFRFITGNSRKQAYSIRTPSATIGIRGTRFDLAVESNGQTNFALFEGAARLCDRAGRCRELSGRCAVAVILPQGGVAEVPAGPERSARLAALFPYVVSQARLNREFQVDTSSCAIRHARLNDPQQGFFDAIAPGAPVGVINPPPVNPGGNPGNDNVNKRTNEPVGGAGESPGNNGDSFGGTTGGRSDVTNSNGNGSARGRNR